AASTRSAADAGSTSATTSDRSAGLRDTRRVMSSACHACVVAYAAPDGGVREDRGRGTDRRTDDGGSGPGRARGRRRHVCLRPAGGAQPAVLGGGPVTWRPAQ